MARQFERRTVHDELQIRHTVQAGFLFLNLWIGVQFYYWVRYFESGGATLYVSRPPGVEGWLPIASLMNLKYLVMTGVFPAVHPAGLVLLIAFLGISIVFRKAFCSWLCPIGTVSEWLWMGGHAIFGRTFALPRWLDVSLRSLKYVLLALFVWVVVTMPAPSILAFLTSPFGLLADVKMLDFFRHAGSLTIQVCAVLVVLSVLTKNFWCRYLCPYGALMGLASLASPMRITRNPATCIDCGKCTRACPSRIPVAVLNTVRTPECNGCLTCVAACPVKDTLEMRTVVRQRRITGMSVAIGVLGIFLLLAGAARATGHWRTSIDESMFFDLIPNASSLEHPR